MNLRGHKPDALSHNLKDEISVTDDESSSGADDDEFEEIKTESADQSMEVINGNNEKAVR